MPQNTFCDTKTFAQGLHPIVVINKVDRPGARPDWVVDQVFDLFDKLGATDDSWISLSCIHRLLLGYATLDLDKPNDDMRPLFETIVKHVPAPDVDQNGSFQMQLVRWIFKLCWHDWYWPYFTWSCENKYAMTIIDTEGKTRQGRILQILEYLDLKRSEVAEASAGDIIAITGIEKLNISDTICDPSCVEALIPLTVDEPTVSMTFQVNSLRLRVVMANM